MYSMSKAFIMNPIIQLNINIINLQYKLLQSSKAEQTSVMMGGNETMYTLNVSQSNTWITPVIKVSQFIQYLYDKKILICFKSCPFWILFAIYEKLKSVSNESFPVYITLNYLENTQLLFANRLTGMGIQFNGLCIVLHKCRVMYMVMSSKNIS